MVVLTFKNVCFLNKQWLKEFCHYFSLNLLNLLLSVSQEKMPVFPLLSIELNFVPFCSFAC